MSAIKLKKIRRSSTATQMVPRSATANEFPIELQTTPSRPGTNIPKRRVSSARPKISYRTGLLMP